jgi:hypothetical protein
MIAAGRTRATEIGVAAIIAVLDAGVKANAFFDAIAFNDLWSRVKPVN